METSIQSSTQLQQMHSITISTREGLHFINPEDIIRLQADSNYTFFHFTNHKPLLVSKVLKEFLPLLEPQGFLRTHRAHLVNRRYVSGVNRTGHVIMRDASKAEISRSNGFTDFSLFIRRKHKSSETPMRISASKPLVPCIHP